MGEEQGNFCFLQHRSRYTAKKTLLKPGMIICAHDDHVGSDIGGMLAQHLIDAAAAAFRDLIELGLQHGGSYYLTYHRWARKDQVERCYPQFAEFLALKRRHDPDELFQSNWYRHYRGLFAAGHD